jgi:hypothetical protein
MKEHEWFVNTLDKKFQVKAEIEEISYEANELYLHEIDESLIPYELKEGLPETLLFETMVLEDLDQTE